MTETVQTDCMSEAHFHWATQSCREGEGGCGEVEGGLGEVKNTKTQQRKRSQVSQAMQSPYLCSVLSQMWAIDLDNLNSVSQHIHSLTADHIRHI